MDNPHTEADALVSSAIELFQQGNTIAAEAQCRQALVAAPAHVDALAVLGLVLHFETRDAEAEEIFAQLVELEPAEPAHWVNLGTARRGGKRFDEALAAFARAAQLGAASADFFYNVGLTHLDRCDFEAARAVLARAVELAPQDAEIRFQYAKSCHESLRTDEASKALEDWEQLEGLTPGLVANIGFLLMSLGEAARAQQALQSASVDPQQDPQVTLTVVQVLERTNRVADARKLLDALAADPRSGSLGQDLLLVQAQLAQRESQHERARQLFERALSGVRDFHLRHFQLFPLAKSLDALGRYDEAFDTLLEAHRSQAAHLAMTAPGTRLRGIPTMAITQYGCDPADVARWDHAGGPPVEASPIFIVGFPRSGTTLLELTLDAHPLLRSMDEQPFVQNALDDLQARGARYPSALAGLAGAQLEEIRARYWERARRKVTLEPGQRLVDKNPLNILRLPVIRRLFPNARILLTVRHPCDVLLSCFMQHFRAPDFALLCGDLPSLVTGYRRTFDFWYEQVRLLEPSVREIRYESFVASLEGEIRAVADFLDLPWDDRMLAPAEHAQAKGYISTPSYAQVVQPVNRRSIGRWRAYQRHFAEVIAPLRPYLERWNYDT